MQLDSNQLINFIDELKNLDENHSIIESFAVNGVPQAEIVDCAEIIKILIMIYKGTLRTNYFKAVMPKEKRWTPKLIQGGVMKKAVVV